MFRPVWASVRNQSTAAFQAVKLHNRSVIRLSGDDCRDFLQGLITNDIQHLGGPATSIYSLFLNKSGRVLYDAVIYGGDNATELFVESDSAVAQDLRKHMMIYRIRRKISIDLVNDEYTVWAAFGGADQEERGKSSGSTQDPRVKDFASRILTRLSDEEMAKQVPTVSNMRSYNLHRYKWGIAEGIKEIIPGKAFPLEVNCDYMHGLSVHKGCYLGQEFTARTYHTGVVRKRIMPIELESPGGEEELIDKDVLTEVDKPGGKVRGLEGSLGIGLLRVELVLAAKQLRVNKTVPVRTWKPDWWPVVASKD